MSTLHTDHETLLQYQSLLDKAAVGISFVRDGEFLHCNACFSDMFGWQDHELVGQPTSVIYPSRKAFDEFAREASQVLGSGQRLDTELMMKKNDGTLFWCRLLGNAIDPADHARGTVFIAEDITARKAEDEARRLLLLEYQGILNNALIGITFLRERRFMHCNDRFGEMFGWARHELVGKSTRMVYPDDAAFNEIGERMTAAVRGGGKLDMEIQMMRRDGSVFWARVLAKSIDPSDPTRGTTLITEDISDRRRAQDALEQARDDLELRVQARTAELAETNQRLQAEIAERQLAEDRVRHLANHDALTGLPNRRLLEDRLDQAMVAARRNTEQLAVQFIDLDRFKAVNDTLGHRIGDLLLQAVGNRLRDVLREIDTVSRVGGDEFVVVLTGVQTGQAAIDTAQKILDALAQPYPIEKHVLTVTPSIGIALFPHDGADVETLISRADIAMYHAKQMGRRNVQIYRADMKVELA